jgi:hypothetical protein
MTADQKPDQERFLRLIASELGLLLMLTAAREMYGRGYFSLGVTEKETIDRLVAESSLRIAEGLSGGGVEDQGAPKPRVGFHITPPAEAA